MVAAFNPFSAIVDNGKVQLNQGLESFMQQPRQLRGAGPIVLVAGSGRAPVGRLGRLVGLGGADGAVVDPTTRVNVIVSVLHNAPVDLQVPCADVSSSVSVGVWVGQGAPTTVSSASCDQGGFISGGAVLLSGPIAGIETTLRDRLQIVPSSSTAVQQRAAADPEAIIRVSALEVTDAQELFAMHRDEI